jgi:trans-2-enoyl-CoA reductase
VANLKKKKTQRARFRYVVKVVETVESQTAIDTDTPLNWNEIKKIAEERRVKGTLSFCGVTDVDSWVSEAYQGGVEVKNRTTGRKKGR